jgi:hypothetical protein
MFSLEVRLIGNGFRGPLHLKAHLLCCLTIIFHFLITVQRQVLPLCDLLLE